jgi:hypothetical protein
VRAAEARQQILAAPLPEGLEADLEAACAELGEGAPWGLAVRSSATCEDATMVSMAGLTESVLGVRGLQALVNAVRQVWASIASGRALAYLAEHGVRDVGMGLVVQRMVEARAGGVIFTQAPDALARGLGARGERIINAGFGLGAPIVHGILTPDIVRIDAQGRLVEAAIAHKPRATVVWAGRVAEVDVETPDAPALDRDDIAALAAIATRLESLDQRPWEVEFACDRERTWIVQARPGTGRGFPDGGDEETVWSNVSVGEALPGVATPFTWSVAGAFSESGFRRAFAALGCRVPKNARLVGNVHGRVYLNSDAVHAYRRPGADARPSHAGRARRRVGRRRARITGSGRQPYAGFISDLPLTASRLLKEQLRLDEDVKAFEGTAEKQWRAQSAFDLAILTDDGVARRVRDIQAMLERTGTTDADLRVEQCSDHTSVSR